MKKLIELLNKYIPKGWSIEHGGKSVFYEGLNYNDRIIGKDFGFIKWLVENDKIDLGKIKKLYRKSNEHSIHTYPIMYEYSDLDNLLMLLSISSSPIEDLISYLK